MLSEEAVCVVPHLQISMNQPFSSFMGPNAGSISHDMGNVGILMGCMEVVSHWT